MNDGEGMQPRSTAQDGNPALDRTFLIRLPEGLLTELDAYCRRNGGRSKASVFREAVQRLVRAEAAA